MPDVPEMDKIVIKVSVDSKDADKKLDKLTASVKSFGEAAENLHGLDNLNKIDSIADALSKIGNVKISASSIKNLDGLANAVKNLNDAGTTNLKNINKALGTLSKFTISPTVGKNIDSVAEGVRGLDGLALSEATIESLKAVGSIQVPATIGTNISKIATGVGKLEGVDFSKLKELVDILANLKGMGDVRINVNTGTANTKNNAPVEAKGVQQGWTDVTKTDNGQDPEKIKTETDAANESAKSLASTFAAIKAVGGKIALVVGAIKKGLAIAVSVAKKLWEIFKKVVSAVAAIGKAAGRVLFAPFIAAGNAVGRIRDKLKELVDYAKRMALRQILRKAINAVTDGLKEGIGNLYEWSKGAGTSFYQSMNDIATSMLYFKNSVAACVSPLLNALAPALRTVTDAAVGLLNIINQLFATLTGAKTWTKAVRTATEYSAATKSAKKSTDELKESLISLDEIHALNDPKSSGGGGGGANTADPSGMFTTETVGLDDLGDNMSAIWSVFEESWKTHGKKAIEECTKSFKSFKQLLGTVKETITEVYLAGEGKTTFDNLWDILGNCATAAGNIADNLREAWKEGNTGYTIVKNLWDASNNILIAWNGITKSIADWSASLDLSPLMTSFANLSATMSKLSAVLGDDLKWAWDNVLLPLGTWMIETFIPQAINTLSTSLDGLSTILSPVVKGFKDAWDNTEGLRKSLGDLIANAVDVISDRFENLKKNIPTEDLERIRTATSKLVEFFETKFINTLATVIEKFTEFAGNGGALKVVRAIEDICVAIAYLQGVAKTTMDIIVAGLKTIVMPITVLYDLFTGNSISDSLTSLFDSYKQIGTDVENTVFNAGYIAEFFNSIVDAAEDAEDGVSDAADKAGISVGNAVDDIAREMLGLPGASKKAADGITTDFTNASKTTTNEFGKFANGVKQNSSSASSSATTSFNGMFANVTAKSNKGKTDYGTFAEKVKSASSISCASATGSFNATFSNMKQKSAESEKALTGGFSKASVNAQKSLGDVSKYFGGTFYNDFSRNSKNSFNSLNKDSNESYKVLKGNLDKIPEDMSRTFTTGAGNIASALSNGGSLNKTIVSGADSCMKSLLNKVIGGLNKAFSSVFGKIQSMVEKLRNMRIMGLEPFKNLPYISVPSIPYLAEGGMLNAGQLFVANEQGPELVGRFGNRTGVMNNDQIVESVSIGVENANASQNALLREQNSLLRQMLTKDSNVRAYVTTSDILNGLAAVNKRSGKAIVPISP